MVAQSGHESIPDGNGRESGFFIARGGICCPPAAGHVRRPDYVGFRILQDR